MGIECRCSACQARFRAPAKYANQNVKCPKCSAPVTVGDLPVAPALADPVDSSADEADVAATDLKVVETPAPVGESSATRLPPVKKRVPPRREESPPEEPPPAAGGFPNIDLGASAAATPARPAAVDSVVPRRKKSDLTLWLAIGGGAGAVVLIAAVAFFLLSSGSGDAPPAARSMPVTGTYFVLEWPADERGDADSYKVYIDRKLATGKPSGDTLRFNVKPGKHQVEIRRRGYDQVTISDLAIQPGETYRYTPQWERSLEGMIATNQPSGPDGAEDFPKPGPAPTFDDWLQDFEAAKTKAAAENKNILVAFDGSDWCPPCMRLAEEVFHQRSFRDQVDKEFVLVLIDFPKKAEAKGKVEDAKRNQALAGQFAVTGYPTVLLTDAKGRPYARLGYEPGGVEAFMGNVAQWQTVKTQRDELFLEIETLQDKTKLTAIRRALALLGGTHILPYYGPTLQEWLAAAEKLDASNEAGDLEAVFAAAWVARLSDAARKEKPDETVAAVKELDEWKDQHEFRDVNLAAALHLQAARAMVEAGQGAEATKYLERGLAFNPTNPKLRDELRRGSMAVEGMPAGTGFVIAPGGYILTNQHVAGLPGKTYVQLTPDGKVRVPAKLLAKDEAGDMALLKVELPEGIDPTPIAIVDVKVGRGARVGAFGYPGSGAVGSGLKLTTGVISALPDQSPDGMFLLDCRVNPGNSGGPLCDAHGNVVGMVTAKSRSTAETDSYGMALPAEKLLKFLEKHLPDDVQLPSGDESGQAMEWDEIDREVGNSVLLILKRP